MTQTGSKSIEEVRYKSWWELFPVNTDYQIVSAHPYEGGFMMFTAHGVFHILPKDGSIKEIKFKGLT